MPRHTDVPPTRDPGDRKPRGIVQSIGGRLFGTDRASRFTRDTEATDRTRAEDERTPDEDARYTTERLDRDTSGGLARGGTADRVPHETTRRGAGAPVPPAVEGGPRRATSMGRAAAARRRERSRGGLVAPVGATSTTGATAKKRRRGGLLLPLLGLLLLLGLIAAAIALFAGGDGEKSSPKGDSAQRQPQEPATPPNPASGPATLEVGGRSIQSGASLGSVIGSEAQVSGAKVVQVDGDAGFFIGGGKGRRTFVEYGGAVGSDEARTMPKVGDTVDVTGPVTRPPEQPGRTFHIPVSSERVILKQGGYINADRVAPAR